MPSVVRATLTLEARKTIHVRTLYFLEE